MKMPTVTDFIEALRLLDNRYRGIIELRGYTGGPRFSLRKIANKYNVTPERIRQMEAKAMRQLARETRSDLGAPGLLYWIDNHKPQLAQWWNEFGRTTSTTIDGRVPNKAFKPKARKVNGGKKTRKATATEINAELQDMKP